MIRNAASRPRPQAPRPPVFGGDVGLRVAGAAAAHRQDRLAVFRFVRDTGMEISAIGVDKGHADRICDGIDLTIDDRDTLVGFDGGASRTIAGRLSGALAAPTSDAVLERRLRLAYGRIMTQSASPAVVAVLVAAGIPPARCLALVEALGAFTAEARDGPTLRIDMSARRTGEGGPVPGHLYVGHGILVGTDGTVRMPVRLPDTVVTGAPGLPLSAVFSHPLLDPLGLAVARIDPPDAAGWTTIHMAGAEPEPIIHLLGDATGTGAFR